MVPQRYTAVVLGTLFGLTALGSSASAVVAPDISRDLDLTTGEVAAIFVAFSIAFAATTAIYGRLGDVHGERAPLVAGVALMATGSVLSAAAPNIGLLTVGRIVQGAGAGAVPALVPGVIRSRISPEGQPAALSTVAATAGIFAAVGPLLGGVAGGAIGWRLALALPVAGLALLPSLRRLTSGSGSDTDRLDRRGAALVAVAVTGVVLVLQAPGLGVSVGIAGAIAAITAGIAWQRHQQQHPDGFTPAIVIRSRGFWLNALVGASLSAVYLSILLAVPDRLATGQTWTAIQIGTALVPAAILGPLASLASKRLTTRVPSNALAGLGVAAAGIGTIPATFADNPALQVAAFASAIFGFGLAQPALIDRVARSTDPSHRGIAVGLFNLLFFVGGAIGSALVGSFGIDTGSIIASCLALGTGLTLAIPHDSPFQRCLHSTGTITGALHCLTTAPATPRTNR